MKNSSLLSITFAGAFFALLILSVPAVHAGGCDGCSGDKKNCPAPSPTPAPSPAK